MKIFSFFVSTTPFHFLSVYSPKTLPKFGDNTCYGSFYYLLPFHRMYLCIYLYVQVIQRFAKRLEAFAMRKIKKSSHPHPHTNSTSSIHWKRKRRRRTRLITQLLLHYRANRNALCKQLVPIKIERILNFN